MIGMNRKRPVCAAGMVCALLVSFCFGKQLRSFIRNGTAAMIYHEPVIREDVMHIACLGDSITYGAGVTDGEGELVGDTVTTGVGDAAGTSAAR